MFRATRPHDSRSSLLKHFADGIGIAAVRFGASAFFPLRARLELEQIYHDDRTGLAALRQFVERILIRSDTAHVRNLFGNFAVYDHPWFQIRLVEWLKASSPTLALQPALICVTWRTLLSYLLCLEVKRREFRLFYPRSRPIQLRLAARFVLIGTLLA